MVQSSLTTKKQSFDVVKTEIEETIRCAESSLERFLDNRDSGEDLQNFVDYLNQLRGICILVELRGGTLLCQEAVALANDVPVGASSEKNATLSTLSGGLLILRRYLDFYSRHRSDLPELLLPVINELREARGEKPYPESCFFDIEVRGHSATMLNERVQGFEGSEKDYAIRARRMRLMFHVALLGVIKDRSSRVNLILFRRAAKGFAQLCQGAPMVQLWGLLEVVAHTMLKQEMNFTRSRKRMMMRIERYARELVKVGQVAAKKNPPDSLIKDLIYILYRSGDHSELMSELLGVWHLRPSDSTDLTLESFRRKLYGPGTDVMTALSDALREEVNQLKDRLDVIERGIEPDINELETIGLSLERLANTLLILEMNQLSLAARQQAQLLYGWVKESRLPGEEELFGLAAIVLKIENTARQLVNGVPSEDENDEGSVALAGYSVYYREALIVLTEEARNAMTLAKREITTFMESDHDKLHLANLPLTLDSIRGGFEMAGDEQAAEIVVRVRDAIRSRFLDARDVPAEEVIEALADSLTSLECYIEGMAVSEARNDDLLLLASTSLKEVGL